MNKSKRSPRSRDHSRDVLSEQKVQPAGDALVFDIRSFDRRPGAHMAVERQVTLKEPIGLDMIRVPAGNSIDLDLTFDMVPEGAFVSGTAYAQITGECTRCLGALDGSLSVSLGELYAYPDSATAASAEADDEDIQLIDDDYIDLSQPLIDAVGLTLPWSPTCELVMHTACINEETPRPDGVAGEQAPPEDPRWSALKDMLLSEEAFSEGEDNLSSHANRED